MGQSQQVQKVQPVNRLTTSIINALETGDKITLSVVLKAYKYPNGAVNYLEVMKVPHSDRLPGLVEKEGMERVHKVLGAAITLAMESLNLKQGLTAVQTLDLVDNILDSATEDYLGLEDVVLFLQKLVRGEAGKLFNSIDIPTFMALFEKYRQDRHLELLKHRKEEHLIFKDLGRGETGNIMLDNFVDGATALSMMQSLNTPEDGIQD